MTSFERNGAAVGAGFNAGADRRRSAASPDPRRWLDDHGDALFRFALVRLGDHNHAEEVVQECLLAALGGVRSFADRSSERTWLIGILKHKIVDHLRRKNRRERRDESEQADSRFFDDRGFWRLIPKRWDEDPSASLQGKEFGTVLLECVRKLPRTMADVVILRELNQLPSEEVCTLLAISPQSLWQRLHRARLNLRRCLEVNWFERTGSVRP